MSCSGVSCRVVSCLALPGLVLPCLVLSRLALPCLAWPGLVLVLSCLALFLNCLGSCLINVGTLGRPERDYFGFKAVELEDKVSCSLVLSCLVLSCL